MNKIKKSIKRFFWMYFVLFVCLILAVIFILLNSSYSINPYNPRLKKDSTDIIRGDIKDCNGKLLATTLKTDEGFKRQYPYNQEFSHIIGYSTFGKTGIELKYNNELSNVKFEIIKRLNILKNGGELKGESLTLTLNETIQKKSYDLLGNQKGAIIVMEPSTGKLLSMVSYPNFNPNTIQTDWKNLNDDIENSPLLNRATQGTYAPGSTYKIVTAACAIENLNSWETFKNKCIGNQVFTDKTIKCFNSKNHGVVDLKQAFAVSCNTTFALLGVNLGSSNLKSISERLGFNKNISYPLDYSKSLFSLNKNSTESELVETAIGQGKTLTTPFQMARIVSAVANSGILMKPYVVSHIEDGNGKTIKEFKPQKEKRLFSKNVSDELTDMMSEVVKTGTGISAKIDGITVAGKTGTAEVDKQLPHSWFVGFAPAENPKVSIVVLLENSGEGGLKATPVAREIIKTALQSLNKI